MEPPRQSPLKESIRPEAQELLGWMRRLDGVMGDTVPENRSIQATGYAQTEVTEAFLLGRRTFGSVHLLMDWTTRTTDPDRTEDAASLVRKLLDLFATCQFIVRGDPAEQDLRAARAILVDVEKHLKALKSGLKIANTKKAREITAEWEEAADALKADIKSAAGEVKPPPNTTDLLETVSLTHSLLWRQLSDVFHGGVMGRSFQRKDLVYGVPAEPERQDFVIHTAVSLMADIFRAWLIVMDEKSEAFSRFSLDWDEFNTTARK